ncbi:MAG TPA: hypothetical protein VHU19_05395 [Pyrinomonadaceae bacterium]|jgi:hypothetical protein|nr:hypothetical protein [Pyrinomonadaceae bacterium]
MTPQDHNKVIGIMHLIWGGFNALTLLILIPFFLLFAGVIGSDPHAPPELSVFFGFFGVLVLLLAALFGIPPIVAGYGMLKRRSWARLAGIISACFTALSFPFGTALCVYTFWFLFSEGENFYRVPDAAAWRGSLRDADAFDWEAQRAADARQKDYTPPPQPPDWRG